MAETVTCLFGPAKELVKCIAPALYPAIKERFIHLCCFNSNIQSLRNEAQQLENVRLRVQSQVDEAENNASDVYPEVKDWLTKTDQILAQKEGIETKIPNVQSGWLNFISRYSLSEEARSTTAAMKELLDQSHEFQTDCLPPCPVSQVPIQVGRLQEFQSRKRIEENVMKALRDKVSILGIGGMGGVGKTTLAKELREKVREERLFDEAVIITVSQQPDTLKIQQEIADWLGLKGLKDLGSKDVRAHTLRNRLMGPKKIFIVLDDIWKPLNMEDVGIPCGDGQKGCTVLLTSRYLGVLSQMGAEVFEMKILSADEAWSLFREKAGTCVEDPDLISIAKQVAIECKGLPLALITVGGALNNKDVHIWNDALHQLKGSHLKKIPSFLIDVYRPLKLSYDFIEIEEAKLLFLLCCLFPEDYDISLEDLTFFCWSLDLFEDISSLEQATRRIFSLVDMLKSRFLLLDGGSMPVDGGSKQHVKMHDIVRDVAIEIAREEGRANVNLRSMGHSCSDYQWISIIVPHASSVYPDDLMGSNVPNLHLLAIHYTGEHDTWEINDVSFLDGMKALNVLSFTRTSFKLLPEISMQSWKNLRTLIFERCWLEDLSFVGNLLSLEILKCTQCDGIEELPDEMKRLKRLKLLEVSHCKSLKRIAPGVISELVKLEELKMLRSFDGWESANTNEEERRNASLKELESLPKLTCLQIEMKDVSLLGENIRLSSNIKEYFIWVNGGDNFILQTHEKVMALNDLPREINLGSWIHKLARTTEVLRLSGDGSYSFDLSQVQKHIKSLQIRDSGTMKKLMIKSDIIRDLESLCLENLPNLEELCDGPILDGFSSFNNLETLILVGQLSTGPNLNVPPSNIRRISINRLDELRNLFVLETAEHGCLQLESLQIDNCEMMEEVFSIEENSINDANESHLKFPKLKGLRLGNLPSLTTFGKGVESIEFPVLTYLFIEDCPKLRRLVSSVRSHQNAGGCNNDEDCPHLFCNPKGGFPSLLQLLIHNCEMMEEVFSIEENSINDANGSHLIFPKLRALTLGNLPSLTTFGKGVESIEFPVLDYLTIEDCPKLRRLASSVRSHQNARGCNNDEDCPHLFCNPKVTFSTLTNLTISGYNDIRRLFSPSTTKDLLNLKSLKISSCDKMEEILLYGENGMNGNVSPITFSKLEILELRDMSSLTTFCKGIDSIEFPVLDTMAIRGCSELVSFVSSNGSNQDLEDGHEDDYFHLFCSEKVAFCGLKHLEIGGYGNITNTWCHKIPHDFFRILERLEIHDCGNIRILFSYSIAENLVNLKFLSIKSCKQMEKVIGGVEKICEKSPLFPSLERLCLEDLSKLRSLCEWEWDLELPMLEGIFISKCSQMELLTLGSLSAPKLRQIKVDEELINRKELNEMKT